MFGLTEREMDTYRDRTLNYAREDMVPSTVHGAQFITPLFQSKEGAEPKPSTSFIKGILGDIENIIVLTTTHLSYEYAQLQCDSTDSEKSIIDYLHTKYTNYLVHSFIGYGVAFTEDIIKDVIGGILLEMPYLYASVIEEEGFDEDKFLEDKMDAYNNYLIENFPPEEGKGG